MIISMKKSATSEQIEHVKHLIESFGYKVHKSKGTERVIFGAIGDERGKEKLTCLEAQPGVEKVIPILSPYKLASRETQEDPTIVDLGMGVTVGENASSSLQDPVQWNPANRSSTLLLPYRTAAPTCSAEAPSSPGHRRTHSRA